VPFELRPLVTASSQKGPAPWARLGATGVVLGPGAAGEEATATNCDFYHFPLYGFSRRPLIEPATALQQWLFTLGIIALALFVAMRVGAVQPIAPCCCG
jgi:hypothetical protein